MQILKKFISWKHIPLAIMLLLFTFLSAHLFASAAGNFIHFNTAAFDFGIQDQGVWLLSHFQTPFSTIRGLNLFGDHVTFIHLFLVPFYWLWDNGLMLLLLQSLAMASGMVFVYFIAKKVIKNSWYSLLLSLFYFFYPSVHFINQSHFYPDNFIILFFMAAFLCLLYEKFKLYYIFMVLCLFCKEEFAATLILFGIYVFFKHSKKHGIITSLMGIVWLVLVIKVFLPYFNGFGYFRNLYGYSVFGAFGSTTGEIIKNILANPAILVKQLLHPLNGPYALALFLPVAFLSLLYPPLLLVSGSLYLNLLSGYYYTHVYTYHYTSLVIPFIFISAIYGFNWVLKRKHKYIKILGKTVNYVAVLLVVLTLFFALYSNYKYGTPSFTIKDIKGTMNNLYYPFKLSERDIQLHEFLASVPQDVNISATYNLVPYVSHRKTVYMLPNPYEVSYWGINGENPHPSSNVQYLLVDTTIMPLDKVQALLAKTGYTLEIEKKFEYFVFARQIKAVQ